MIITLVWLTGGTGIILLLARSYTGKQILGAVGQSLLSCSFALISISLIHTTKFWVGIAFGVSAISQAIAVMRWLIRRGRASTNRDKQVAENPGRKTGGNPGTEEKGEKGGNPGTRRDVF
jgi:hypothetical protein